MDVSIEIRDSIPYMNLSIPMNCMKKIFMFKLNNDIVKNLHHCIKNNLILKYYEVLDIFTGNVYLVEFHKVYDSTEYKYRIIISDTYLNYYSFCISKEETKKLKYELLEIIKNY